MKICLIGDVHGRVFHALLLVNLCQQERQEEYDLIIQVGDLGVWPDPNNVDAATKRFAKNDRTELDFQFLVDPKEDHRRFLELIREKISVPILFIRGNHEDSEWLQKRKGTLIDQFGIFEYVADGDVREYKGAKVAFLGGIEGAKVSQDRLDDDAVQRLLSLGSGAVDVLITHDAPYGVSTGFRGQTQGSRIITRVATTLRPRFHAYGHLHHIIGPSWSEDRASLGLSLVLENIREESDRLKQPVKPGCLAILDLQEGRVEPVVGDWLADVRRDLELDEWCARIQG